MKHLNGSLIAIYVMSILIAGAIYWVNSPSKEDIRSYRQSYCDGNCGSDWDIGRELWWAQYKSERTTISPTHGDFLLGYIFLSVILFVLVSFSNTKNPETVQKQV